MSNERDNMNPHAEAIVAMCLWSEEYAGQNGGCMDFWDNLRPHRQRHVVDIVNRVAAALRDRGRAGKDGGNG